MKYPDQEYLKSILTYNPKTGDVTWTNGSAGGMLPGDGAGCDLPSGAKIKLGEQSYSLPRIVWILVTGSEPEHRVQFRNGDRTDLSWGNLYDGTSQVTRPRSGKKLNLPLGVTAKGRGFRANYRGKFGKTLLTIDEARNDYLRMRADSNPNSLAALIDNPERKVIVKS